MARKPAVEKTSPRKPVTKPTTKTGFIPRTHKAALKLGYEPADIKFSDLPDAHKASFMQFAESGRTGTICGTGPSTDDRFWLVCYKQDGKCNWVHVPRGETMVDHE